MKARHWNALGDWLERTGTVATWIVLALGLVVIALRLMDRLY